MGFSMLDSGSLNRLAFSSNFDTIFDLSVANNKLPLAANKDRGIITNSYSPMQSLKLISLLD